MRFTIDEATLPATLDDGSTEAADFITMTSVRNAVEADVVGNDDIAPTVSELFAAWQDPYDPRRLLLARVGGQIIGRGVYEVQIEDGVVSAWLTVEVLPDHRRRGIGAALHEQLVRFTRDEHRSILQANAMHRADAGGHGVLSPTGHGSVPSGDPGVHFALAHGYRLAQVERMSRLDLPVAVTVPSPTAGYSLLLWEGQTPTHHLADLADLHAGMSTDTPLGELDYFPEVWDADRVRAADSRALDGGRRLLTAAVQHDASGALVGFSQLTVPPEPRRPIDQGDTIVAGGHRGHRLGMLLKAANLARLEADAPGHPAVYTWNAEENRHMLAVNEALGFTAIGYHGGWRREL